MTEVPPPKKEKTYYFSKNETLKTPSHDMIQVAWYATGKHGMIIIDPKWYGLFKLHEVWGGGGGDPLPLLSSLSEGQLEQNFFLCNYVTNSIKNHNDINTGPL